MTLDDLPKLLDEMTSKHIKKNRTFVARYKGKNLVTTSGKSSWRAVGHAKLAIQNHFHEYECGYVNGYKPYGDWRERKYNNLSWEEREIRKNDFRAKLWELIEIVELE